MNLKKFLLGGLLAIAGFASVFAIIQPDIRGWTTTNTASLTTDWMIIQSGTDQKKITVGDFANSILGLFGLTGYYPLSGNSVSNPITGPLYMAKGSGAFNLEILTGQNVGLPMTADVPVLTPTAFLPGAGIFKVMLTKGRQFFMGEPGENTQMYLVNSTGDIGWRLDSNDNSARFKLQPFTGGAMNGLMGYTQWNVDGTIQAGNTGIITAINAGTPETYVTKGYVDTVTDEYIPRTAVTTGMTYPGSDTIIPSEKAIYSLLDGIAEDLGDVLTTGGYYISGTNQRRTVESGDNYSIEYSINGGLGRNQSAYAGFSGLYDGIGNPYLTSIITNNLTNTYVPYRSGDRFYNSNTIYNPIAGRLELGGRSGVVNYSGVALLASGGAYFYADNMLGGFSIPIYSGAGMFGWASGTGRYAGYLQTSSNAGGLRIDANSTSTAGLFETQFGTILDLTTINGTGISINKILSSYEGGIALSIGYDGLSNMSVDYTGNISTNGDVQIMGWQYFGTGWRQGLSGNNFVTQAFTGGVWVEKASLTP